MTSAVIIVPATALAAGNALGEAMGWGPENFTVALSATGSSPATHYLCRAEVGPSFADLLADPPPVAAAVLPLVMIDMRETDDPYAHAMDVLAAQGLQLVQQEA